LSNFRHKDTTKDVNKKKKRKEMLMTIS